MSKIIVRSSSSSEEAFESLVSILADKNTYVSDVDGTLYDNRTGIYKQGTHNVVHDLASYRAIAPFSFELAKRFTKKGLAARHDLNWVLPLIIDWYRRKEHTMNKDLAPAPNFRNLSAHICKRPWQRLESYLKRVYDIDYSPISPQPEFVKSEEVLRANGKRLVFYSGAAKCHIQNVLDKIGFPHDAFGEENFADVLKIDRNPNLLSQFAAEGFSDRNRGALFDKATRGGFERMARALKLGPLDNIAFFDDSLESLSLAPKGILKIHIAKNKESLFDPESAKVRDFAVYIERDENEPFASPVGLLLEQVAHHLQKPEQKQELLSTVRKNENLASLKN